MSAHCVVGTGVVVPDDIPQYAVAVSALARVVRLWSEDTQNE